MDIIPHYIITKPYEKKNTMKHVAASRSVCIQHRQLTDRNRYTIAHNKWAQVFENEFQLHIFFFSTFLTAIFDRL